MKNFLEGILVLYLSLAFVFFAFGTWSIWTLILGIILGFIIELAC